MKLRSQVSTEFVIIFGVAAVILIVVGILIQREYAETSAFKLHAAGDRIAKRFAENINEVAVVGAGFSQCFTVPGYVLGVREYNTEFFSGEPTVFVEAGDDTWSAPLLSAKVKCRHPICYGGSGGHENSVWAKNFGEFIRLYECPQGCRAYCAPTCKLKLYYDIIDANNVNYCDLYGDFIGEWGFNQRNWTIVDGTNIFTVEDMPDGLMGTFNVLATNETPATTWWVYAENQSYEVDCP